MSSIFEAVRSQVPVRAAAERYGLEVNDSGMARCPFHNDRTPSMKLYADHFYCFGCGKYGDVVDMTSELLCVPSYDAACALAEEFAGRIFCAVSGCCGTIFGCCGAGGCGMRRRIPTLPSTLGTRRPVR